MSKKAHERRLADTEAQAVARVLRTSPRKLNLVCQTIRGRSAEQALAELTFSKRRIARDVRKTLQSAIANDRRQVLRDEALSGAGPWACRAPLETLEPPDPGGSRA
jgi:ribosomal protein L22